MPASAAEHDVHQSEGADGDARDAVHPGHAAVCNFAAQQIVPLVRMSHQAIDPQNIPTIRSEVSHKGRCLPSPRVASTVKKERTVVGLAIVRTRAEAKSELAAAPFWPASMDSGGLK